ncbi:MAG: hypothetical protein LBD30_03345, partial [Verrucomicrobiales bacterium]|nr:hypothetical protein [Verrucomicrobiales bacterium]
SDYFTLGAEKGLLMVSVATGLLGSLLWYSLREGRRRENILQVAFSATLVTLLVSSVFSTLAFVRWYQSLFGLSVLGLLWFIAVSFCKNSDKKRFVQTLILQTGIGMMAGMIGFGTMALVSLKRLPTKSSVMETSITCRLAKPRCAPAKGTIIYLTKPGEDVAVLCHTTLRPLAALGWNVVWSGEITEPEQVFALVAECQRRLLNTKLYIAGNDEGGKLAWQTISSPMNNGMIAKAAGYGFLDDSLPNQTPQPSTPFLIYHALYDDQCSANPSILAQRKMILSQVPLTVVLSEQETAKFSDAWMHWLKTLDLYFCQF